MLGEFFFFSEFIKEDMSDLLIPCASTACYFYHKTGETINSCGNIIYTNCDEAEFQRCK